MKMGWGGTRKGSGRKRGSKNPNAGRRRGSLNRLTRVVAAEFARTGLLPHEILLRICQGRRIAGFRLTTDDRIKAAKAAAPYYHPRLRAIVVAPDVQSDAWDEIARLVEGGRHSQAAKRR